MIGKRITLLLALILILTPFVWSQTQSDVVTLKGLVGETTLLSNNDLHVCLQGDRAGSEVCLGPARFLEDQGVLPAVGDRIEVTGPRVGNGSLLVADSLQMGGKNLKLRGAAAIPDYPGCTGHHCACGDCGGCGHHCNHHGHGCDHE